MNVQAYILSGIVESYVLGLASPEEQAEFEAMVAQHPEVLQARLAFETALEEQAMAAAVAPPAALKEEIRAALFNDTDNKTQVPVVHLQETPVRQMNPWKYVAAASIVLLAGSLIWNVNMLGRNKDLAETVAGKDSQLASANSRIDTMTVDIKKVINPDMKMVVMPGTANAPQAYATIYWDTTSHDVFLAANNLPVPASDKQYQLWAIFQGKPVDLGVFDVKQEKLLIRAKNAQGAEAFAITLEKKGGSAQPEGTMYVLGKL
ncbi:MAG: anti-sigma factor [Chitinophagaceae bacterium]|nr:MAG: anti-sigma factor [Chitinophagaceae bacterium]